MTKTPFMDFYYRKRNTAAIENKRKLYDVETAVKKIKVVMGSQENPGETSVAVPQKPIQSKKSSDSNSYIKKSQDKFSNSNELKREFSAGYNLLLSGVRISNKRIGASSCELNKECLMVRLDDMFSDVSGMMKVKYEEIVNISLERNPFKFTLRLTPKCAKNLKGFFEMEPWRPNNYSDDSSTNLQLLCITTVSSDVVTCFYKQLSIYSLNHKSQSVIKMLPIDNRKPEAMPVSDCSDVSIEMEEIRDESVGLKNCISIDGKTVEDEIEVEKTVEGRRFGIDVASFYGKTTNGRSYPGKTEKKDDDDDGEVLLVTKIIKKKCIRCGGDLGETGPSGHVKRLKCLKCIKQKKKEEEEEEVKDDTDIVCVKEVAEKDVTCRNLFNYPAHQTPGRITFTTIDLACLEPEAFFNDVCIDFYLKYFHNELQSPEDRDRTHIFSSFFYSHLTSDTKRIKEASLRAKQRHERVKKWTRNVDIFSKDFIIIPINQKFHWFLAIICFPGLCVQQQEYKSCSLLGPTPTIKKNTSLAQQKNVKTLTNNKTSTNNDKTKTKNNMVATKHSKTTTQYDDKSTRKEASKVAPVKSDALIAIASYKSDDSEQEEDVVLSDSETNGEIKNNFKKSQIIQIEEPNTNGNDRISKSKTGRDVECDVVEMTDDDDVESNDVLKSPLILVFDSLGGGRPRYDIASTLRQYLQVEWNVKKGIGKGEEIFTTGKMKSFAPKCPQQENYYDCGSYLLLYVQYFFLTPIRNFQSPIKGIYNWFLNDEAQFFRRQLKELAISLAKKESSLSDAATSSPLSSSVNQLSSSCDTGEFCELLDASL